MKKNELAAIWLERAASNLAGSVAMLKAGNVNHEDVCYFCQQTAEKALKALCIYLKIEYEFTHSVSFLIDIIEKNNFRIPEKIKDASDLTTYAVKTRYPGDYVRLKKRDSKTAIKKAKSVYDWVEKQVSKNLFSE